MRVGLPIQWTSQIAESAVKYAREDFQSRGWSGRSSGSLMAFPREGTVGIRTTLNYVMFQNRGIKSFVMWSLEGKTIPINDGSGVHFIKATGVGQPGFVTLPGGVKKWRDQKWKHPGLKPKRFMEDSLQRAITENRSYIQSELVKILSGRSKI